MRKSKQGRVLFEYVRQPREAGRFTNSLVCKRKQQSHKVVGMLPGAAKQQRHPWVFPAALGGRVFLVAVILISVQKMPGALGVWLVVSPAGTTTHPRVEGRTISNSTSGPQLLVRKRVCHWRAACWVSEVLSFLGF